MGLFLGLLEREYSDQEGHALMVGSTLSVIIDLESLGDYFLFGGV